MFIGKAMGRAERDGSPGLQFDMELTEEEADMSADEATELIGDGEARVTVSSDRADKYMGTGTSVFCSVTLTCNQDIETIAEAQALAGELVMGFLPDMLARAEAEWKPAPEPKSPSTSKRGSGRGRRGR